MKAIVYTEYGGPDVLHVAEVEKPTPKAHEILIRVHAAPVNYGDLTARNFAHMSAGQFNMPSLLWLPARIGFGWRKPRNHILGSEFAGDVEVAGAGVTRFKVGDAVFGYRAMRMGTYAEYICMAEDGMVTNKPSTMSYEEAAAVPYGALTALSLLRKVTIQAGHKVLINGASGGIGSAAVQLAKHYGAEVTGVCSTARMEYVRALGADQVIDYTHEDFTQNGETYDLIFDVLGRSAYSCKSLKPHGRYLYGSFKTRHLIQMLGTSIYGSKKVICALSSEKPDDLRTIRDLAEAGVIKSIVDRCYPMEQAAEAHRALEGGQARGKVVIVMG